MEENNQLKNLNDDINHRIQILEKAVLEQNFQNQILQQENKQQQLRIESTQKEMIEIKAELSKAMIAIRKLTN